MACSKGDSISGASRAAWCVDPRTPPRQRCHAQAGNRKLHPPWSKLVELILRGRSMSAPGLLADLRRGATQRPDPLLSMSTRHRRATLSLTSRISPGWGHCSAISGSESSSTLRLAHQRSIVLVALATSNTGSDLPKPSTGAQCYTNDNTPTVGDANVVLAANSVTMATGARCILRALFRRLLQDAVNRIRREGARLPWVRILSRYEPYTSSARSSPPTSTSKLVSAFTFTPNRLARYARRTGLGRTPLASQQRSPQSTPDWL